MGVHGLTSILKRYAPNAVRNVSCASLAKQTIAIDASCHLNKFIYGDESHSHRHIFGFYQLAQFCDLNSISPIFVFDGPKRLEAKQMEHAKRAHARRKVKHSLLFEQEQSIRLDNWLEVSNMCDQAMMSKESALAILSELGETLEELEEDLPDINEAQEEEDDDDMVPMEKQQEHEMKLMQIAQELKLAVLNAEDTDKYTRTVRHLAFREKELMSNMISNRFKNLKASLQMLRKDNQNMLTSLEKRSYLITQNTRDECQEFLRALGYICFTCENHEAEAMCANLSKSGRAVATVSEDMDTLVFGDVPILRYFYSRGRPILSIDPVIARQDLNLSRDAFMDLCILCGTDFSGTIQGIGPNRALEAMRKYGSIEQLLQNLEPKYTPHDTFNYQLARNVFNDLPPIPEQDSDYVPRATTDLQINELLEHYNIDPVEAYTKIRTVMLRQSIVDVHNWGTNPFAATAIDSTLVNL